MKNQPLAHSHSQRYQRLGGLSAIALVITALVMYGLWQWVVVPDNEQRFEQQVNRYVAQYRRDIQQYLVELEKPLPGIASQVPNDIFTRERVERERWLQQQQSAWLQQLPHAKTVTLLSVDEVKAKQVGALSFIVIDMMNRLALGEPILTEVAKSVATGEWLLHKIIAVDGVNGIVHITYSLEGLMAIFSQEELRLGRVILRQYLNNQAPLQFLSLGQSSSSYIEKVVNVPSSYWQLSYQPSDNLAVASAVTPMWFWALFALFPMVVIVGMWVTRSPSEVIASRPTASDPAPSPVPSEEEDVSIDHMGDTDESSSVSDDNKAVASSQSEPEEAQFSLPDHIFRAYDIRGLAHTEFSHDLVYAIGQAVATEVLKAGESAMVVGYDARTHSHEFAQCVTEGILSTGCDVIDIGLVPTPLMNFTACQHDATSSGLVITASHNPATYNGCKMVVKGETLVDEDIQRLKARIVDGDITVGDSKGSVTQEDLSQAYVDYIASDVAVMDGWHIVVDAGNGAASHLAPRLLTGLGCKVTPLFCEFDGEFPNHDPDPSVPSNLASLIETVTTKKADIGFALDGDGDRLMVVTKNGRVLWPDQLLMLFAQDIVARHPGSDVVFDIKSTHLLGEAILEHGGRPVMWKTGHSHIKSKMKQTGALLGGEFSGHIFFKERWFGFDDGLYAAARLLEILTLTGQTIDQLADALPTVVSTPEIKIAVTEAEKFNIIEKLMSDDVFANGNRTMIDGLRVDFDYGWGLVRASNTAPVLTLRFEAKDEESLASIKSLFQTALENMGLSLPEES